MAESTLNYDPHDGLQRIRDLAEDGMDALADEHEGRLNAAAIGLRAEVNRLLDLLAAW